MKSATWYIAHAGRRFFAETKAEARRMAQEIADMTGKPVTVRPHKPKTATPAKAAAPKRKVMKRNGDAGSIIDVLIAQQRHQEARRAYNAATKGRRLAKGLRGLNRGGAVKAAEAAASKTAKFVVSARRGKETFTLYRASRRAADDLAGEFAAAGYAVAVKEV